MNNKDVKSEIDAIERKIRYLREDLGDNDSCEVWALAILRSAKKLQHHFDEMQLKNAKTLKAITGKRA